MIRAGVERIRLLLREFFQIKQSLGDCRAKDEKWN